MFYRQPPSIGTLREFIEKGVIRGKDGQTLVRLGTGDEYWNAKNLTAYGRNWNVYRGSSHSFFCKQKCQKSKKAIA
jgi:hypothetical protein